MNWFYLIIAISSEICGTIALKKSASFTDYKFSLLTAVAYITAMYFLSRSLESIELSTAYSIWSGLGILGAHIAGIYLFKENLTISKTIGAILIIIGTVLIQIQKKA